MLVAKYGIGRRLSFVSQKKGTLWLVSLLFIHSMHIKAKQMVFSFDGFFFLI